MEKRELICIGCPLGCAVTVELEDGKVLRVSGNTCKRGETYAINECTHPMRMVTSSVAVTDGVIPQVSVKTAGDIPKGDIVKCMQALKGVTAAAPVHIGDVIVADVVGTGVDVIATKNVERKR